jgi:predicted Na+-dependent transporter
MRAAKLLKLVRKIFGLIAIVWKWIIEHTLRIPFMTLMGMILERKMLIMCPSQTTIFSRCMCRNFDGNLQLCLSMFNSENFRFVEHICDD